MAAIVTTVVTVILLGVLIPIFQTDAGEERRGPRQPRVPGRPSTTTRPRPKSPPLGKELKAIPHVASVEFDHQRRGAEELEEDLGKEKAKELLAQLSENPLPANFTVKADDAAQPARGSAKRSSPPGPNGQRAADLADRRKTLRSPAGQRRRSSR